MLPSTSAACAAERKISTDDFPASFADALTIAVTSGRPGLGIHSHYRTMPSHGNLHPDEICYWHEICMLILQHLRNSLLAGICMLSDFADHQRDMSDTACNMWTLCILCWTWQTVQPIPCPTSHPISGPYPSPLSHTLSHALSQVG